MEPIYPKIYTYFVLSRQIGNVGLMKCVDTLVLTHYCKLIISFRKDFVSPKIKGQRIEILEHVIKIDFRDHRVSILYDAR
jgi:hypothetical protein